MIKRNVWKKSPILLWKCDNNGRKGNPSALKYNQLSVMCFKSESPWEPIENLGCRDLVTDFETSLKRKSSKRKRTPAKKLPPNSSSRSGGQSNDFTAFQGLTAEAIVGATDSRGEVQHLVKWEGKDELELVPALFTTMKFPDIVMAFYGNRVNFICDNLN